MRKKSITLAVFLLLPLIAGAQQRAAYSWVDDDGVRHYGDKIPVEYADKPKSLLNEHGVVVGHIEGKKTEEELKAARAAKLLTRSRIWYA